MGLNSLLYGELYLHYLRIGQELLLKVKVIPRQAEAALWVPGRLRPRIISTFGTTRVVSRQPYAPAAFTPGEIPGTHFQRLSRPQGTWFCRKEPRTPSGIDPGTVRLVAQRLNHYATPGPHELLLVYLKICSFPNGSCCMFKDIRFDLSGRSYRRFDKLCGTGQDIRTTTVFGVYFLRLICEYDKYAAGLVKQMCNACEFVMKKRNCYSSCPLRHCSVFVEQLRTTF